MSTITKTYRGLSLIAQLNWDRILYVAIISMSLVLGLFVGSL